MTTTQTTAPQNYECVTSANERREETKKKQVQIPWPKLVSLTFHFNIYAIYAWKRLNQNDMCTAMAMIDIVDFDAAQLIFFGGNYEISMMSCQ